MARANGIRRFCFSIRQELIPRDTSEHLDEVGPFSVRSKCMKE